jgi:hypothetical protein
MKSIKVKRFRNSVNKTARYHRNQERHLRQAGFVVVPLSELSQLRANIKSMLDILSNDAPRNDDV